MANQVLASEKFTDALIRAGVIHPNDLPTLSRIVIDVRAGHPVQLHIQRHGEKSLLDVAGMLTIDPVKE